MPTVPRAGVPASVALPVPGVNETPDGGAPLVRPMDGVGTPVAVTVKEPALPTVNVVALALSIVGGTGVGCGVVVTVDEAAPPEGKAPVRACAEQV